VSIRLKDQKEIPDHAIEMVPCEDFRLPPQGLSKEEEFDVLCHLELEKEVEEKAAGGEEEEDAASEKDEDQEEVIRYK
jgi:hypothetical protein